MKILKNNFWLSLFVLLIPINLVFACVSFYTPEQVKIMSMFSRIFWSILIFGTLYAIIFRRLKVSLYILMVIESIIFPVYIILPEVLFENINEISGTLIFAGVLWVIFCFPFIVSIITKIIKKEKASIIMYVLYIVLPILFWAVFSVSTATFCASNIGGNINANEPVPCIAGPGVICAD